MSSPFSTFLLSGADFAAPFLCCHVFSAVRKYNLAALFFFWKILVPMLSVRARSSATWILLHTLLGSCRICFAPFHGRFFHLLVFFLACAEAAWTVLNLLVHPFLSCLAYRFGACFFHISLSLFHDRIRALTFPPPAGFFPTSHTFLT